MNSPDSHPDAVSTNRFLAGRGMLHHLVCGCALMLPFARIVLPEAEVGEVSSTTVFAVVSMMGACLLIGLGSGFPLQSWIRRSFGIVPAIRTGLTATLVGSLMTLFGPEPLNLPVGSLLIGLGLFGEWTIAAELTRHSFSSSQQWGGMRIHAMIFFVGALLTSTAADLGGTAALSAVGMGCGVMCLILLLIPPNLSPTVLQQLRSVDGPPLVPETGSEGLTSPSFQEQQAAITDAASAADGECDATECCGGGCAWTPMPVWLGSCLAFTGLYQMGAILPEMTAGFGSSVFSSVLLSGLMGIVLFQSVLPTTGYAVLLVPCCILGSAAFGLSPWLGSVWPSLWVIIQGATAAAIYCGCSGLVGESFGDTCQRNSRTIVLMLGGMAAAAVAVLTGVAAMLLVPSVIMFVNAGICVLGIVWLRQIPSLLISQRREDEMPKQDADELMAESISVAGSPTP